MRLYLYPKLFDMKTRVKIFLFFIAGTFISTQAVSQNSTSIRLDSFFQSLYKYGQINGNILIAEKGPTS